MFENITYNNELLAIIIYDSFYNDGVNFFTHNHLPQQVAFMHHQQGNTILPHYHTSVSRVIEKTMEVLFIKKGVLRVDFYFENEKYLFSKLLRKGDIILLVSGGHGFFVIEDLEMIEVKQGPFLKDNDKIRFNGCTDDKILIK